MTRDRGPTKYLALLVTTLVALGPISTDLYLPALPALSRDLQRDEASAQLTLSVFLVGFGLAQLVYGPFADRFGRRPVMLAGLAVYCGASLACMFAPTMEALIAARLLQALGACAGPVVGRAIIRDAYGAHDSARALAYVSAAMAVAPMLGPVLGGALTVSFGWRANFAALAIFSTLQFFVVLFWLAETSPSADRQATRPSRIAANFGRLLSSTRYRGFLACSAAAYSGLFSFISGSSFVLIDTYGLSPQWYGAAFGFVVAGYIAGTLISGRYAVRAGPRRMVCTGALFAALAGSAQLALQLAGVTGIVSILACVAAYMLATGLLLPSAVAGALAPYPDMAGAASALLGCVQMSVAACVGVLVGHLYDGSAFPMVLAIAICGWTALGCWAIWLRPVAA